MTFRARLVIAFLLVGSLAAGIAFLAAGDDAAGARANVRWESAAQCRECHADVFAEWHGSHHQIAFTNPEVRELSDDFRKEECMDCHLPRPLAITGFGKRTLPRRTHFEEGVSCISCHLAPDGGILGRNDRPDAPCRPRRSDEAMGVDACMSCHNQHGTTDQWRESSFAQQGIACADCHMPKVERRRPDSSVRIGRGHVYPGAHDVAMLKQAYRFTAARRGAEIVLALANTGAGHNFPTEERHRAVDMMYRFHDPDGVGDWVLAWRCRQPYRDEPGENTQLPAGATKEVAATIPAGATAADVRLWYRLTPFCDDQDPRSTLLEELRIDLR
jgi:hypothetical protein